MSTAFLDGIAPLADRHDALVLDLWGTLHDGIAALPGAVDALARLRQAGKQVALLSNVPLRAEVARQVVRRVGIADDLYDAIVSSGEVTWQAIATRPDDWYRGFGRRCWFIGHERHRSMLDNPGLDVAATIEDADFVLCTNPRTDTDPAEAYAEELAACAARGLPLICANPDRVVLRGTVRQTCAGAIAELYERDCGGAVRWHGKPDPSAFAAALAALDAPASTRVLVVGDSLATDIAGARNSGHHSALICGGIHAEALDIAAGELPAPERLAALARDYGAVPDWALTGFVW
ncbi:MAG: TIGR01459 family HAD-type hydrolase [Alphaproteobacteria bacterium]